MSGVKVVSLVETNMAHNYASEKTMNSVHYKPESSITMYKVVNSEVEPIVGVVHSTPLRVGSWFGYWELKVAPLDDQTLVSRQDFLIFSKGVPLLHVSFLIFLDEAEMPSMSMIINRNLG